MKDFPEFMKNKKNHISSNQQNTEDIDGYYFEGADGSQMVVRWLFGHAIQIECLKNISMNLMNIRLLLQVSIQQLLMEKRRWG
ncbi:Conserved hypothetical protein [Clostridium acetobutylicum EA 2018]|uniref:Uncharacterized protein n=1 Tax=Clostridium acetobutylicum (strain ATCC 824 / DSM 792 / JCM 1419 / IAM 19013 / LMG 5710 / NBRC 13948 / NRRL B-527 / VKM B-1787 / 2291 / W) TaxID=272562 RepID=Q97G14_CLOAB|nr:Hypothetical protein CA_C2558 [Clostridium acetobutylicum ATCC 824]ADZ21608.1 Conserved hypothetical protein [Clostridium acetobutylicum EA 2018]AEI32431.1 hypothetical protein SMB_G2593 [Clostridium acetobutylicum DSM 1731]AWV79073.1 hypothetical protein DK921_02965 [Clostridium acetobutylicum]PSM07033.1 hypothetical protein C7T89_02965 [Clostridium sp. NJ4]